MTNQVIWIHNCKGTRKKQSEGSETTESGRDETLEMILVVPSQGKYIYIEGVWQYEGSQPPQRHHLFLDEHTI
jgi:hypothetical protein